AVLTLQPNEISRPFEFGDSLYMVQVIERTESERLTFEQARPYIQDILTERKHDELLAQLTDTLFNQANVVIYQSVLEAYFKQLPTPVTP
ncbi:MAG: peptidylprolyl isomerase, partial [Longimicrobiales bacterium]